MPTYQYRCKECGHDFEIVQAFTDDALTKCPECKKKALKKVYGSVGISFKGSGFYKNDARSGSSKSSGESSSDKADKGDKPDKAGKGADTSGGEKSETKSDAKSGTKKADSKKESKSSTATKSSD